MKSEIQLDDLIAVYPDQDDEDIQNLITNKREYCEYASLTKEATPMPGDYYVHQKLVQRLIQKYPCLMVAHDTGTGKSCTITGAAQYFKRRYASKQYEDILTEEPYLSKAYFFVKGKSLVSEMKNQIVCYCTGGEYETERVLAATNESTRKSLVTRELKNWYKIKTYKSFANKLATLSDDAIISKYSGCMFFLDEVHNIATDHNTKENSGVEVEGEEKESKITIRIGSEERVVTSTYYQFYRLFHVVKRSKIVIASATPMINDPAEVRPIMNLILDENHQIPSNINWSTVNEDTLEPYFRGKISYVRAFDTGIITKYEGETLDIEYNYLGETEISKTIVYKSNMSKHMTCGYLIASSIEDMAYRSAERQASSFIFPDGSYGKDGYDRWTTSSKGPKVQTEARKRGRPTKAELEKRKSEESSRKPKRDFTPEMKELIRENGLNYYSCKFAAALNEIKKAKGICFVYCNYVQAEAKLFGLCLALLLNFSEYRESTTAFIGEGISSYCPKKGDIVRSVRLSKSPRYCLLTGETESSQHDSMMALLNSTENMNGEYIKVIIGSPSARDGINIANATQIHILGGPWNRSSSYQAQSRAIRATSHTQMLKKLEDELEEQGRNRAEAKIEVSIYFHAACPIYLSKDQVQEQLNNMNEYRDKRNKLNIENIKIPPRNKVPRGVDVDLYLKSEEKDRRIRRIFRIMKRCAVDCQIQYGRNFRPTDINGSEVCDYEDCDFGCYSNNGASEPCPAITNRTDFSTYDIYFIDDLVDRVVIEVKAILKTKPSISLSELSKTQSLKKYHMNSICLAIEKLAYEKELMLDSFGFPCYIVSDGDVLFLSREYPYDENKSALSYYASNLFTHEKEISLTNYMIPIETERRKGDIEKILSMNLSTDKEKDEFYEILDSLQIADKVRIVEEILMKRRDGGEKGKKGVKKSVITPQEQEILNRFEDYIFEFEEPVNEIEQIKESMKGIKTGRGRRKADPSKRKIVKHKEYELEDLEFETGGQPVIVHSLYNIEVGTVGYAVTAQFAKVDTQLRILESSKDEWRDVTEYEKEVYNKYIQKEIQDKLSEYEQYDVYGTILKDGKFRIRDKRNEDEEEAVRDSRKKKKGKVCGASWVWYDLLDLLWHLEIAPPKEYNEMNKKKMIDDILNKAGFETKDLEVKSYPLERLQFYYDWFMSNPSKSVACDELKDWFQENGRLFISG
jgi:hypothetical protein